MAARREPRWLTREMVEAIHALQLSLNGGLPGLRDPGALESALGRPKHQWHYQSAENVFDCAAAYGFGLAKNHAFSDGNKRTAFVSMATFLERNGFPLNAPEAEAVITMLAVAEGHMKEAELAKWLRENSKRRLKKKK